MNWLNNLHVIASKKVGAVAQTCFASQVPEKLQIIFCFGVKTVVWSILLNSETDQLALAELCLTWRNITGEWPTYFGW